MHALVIAFAAMKAAVAHAKCQTLKVPQTSTSSLQIAKLNVDLKVNTVWLTYIGCISCAAACAHSVTLRTFDKVQ